MIEQLHNSLIFFPSKDFVASPDKEGIIHEEVYIRTDDRETLHGYFFPAKEKTNKVVLYLHGNGDNVGGWYPGPVNIQNHMSINALLIDYRGYGKSTGKPTISGVIKDAFAMYKYLIDRGYEPENISLYGRSLGGAIVLELANIEKIRSIVIQSSFTSLRDVARDLYPYVPSFVIENKLLNSASLIKNIHVPVLIGHGSSDEIIPVSHGYRLFELANEPKKLIIQKRADHNGVGSYFDDGYFEALRELFL